VADRIELRGLVVPAICGVLPEEQVRAQPIEVDVDLDVDLAAAGASDDLADTVDYGAVCDLVERVLLETRAALLEHLAERIAQQALIDPRLERVEVAVRKLRPPVPQLLATSGVRIVRGR